MRLLGAPILLLAGLLSGQAPVNGGPVGPVATPPPGSPSVVKPGADKKDTGKPDTGKPEAGKDGGAVGEAKPSAAAPPEKGNQPDAEKGKPTPPPVDAEDEADVPLPSPTQLPRSADPADIAAMQSAQAMIKAEARLRRLLKKGDIKGIDKILTFEEISSWPYQDGLKGMPDTVKKMDSRTVLMTGFMLPIDEVENIKEFLLVQSMWSCCYGQPPDINGIVRVVMQGGKRIGFKYDPIKVTGKFKVVATFEDGYCIDIYQLLADEVDVIK